MLPGRAYYLPGNHPSLVKGQYIMATSPAKAPETAPAVPAGSIVIPTVTVTDPITPSGRPALPNPYEAHLASMEVNTAGYSVGHQIQLPNDDARTHENAIRRAAKKLELGMSVIARPLENGTHTLLTFGIVPKRVRNTEDGSVATPSVETPGA